MTETLGGQSFRFPARTLAAVTIYSIAMGFLESAVVVYLRELFVPAGHAFPTDSAFLRIAGIEELRETATVVMLLTVGWISGRSARSRLGWFLLAFGVWDLCYYLFLKLLLGWPASILTWDVLFLIPVPWTAPVLAPVISATSMIVLALIIIQSETRQTESVGGEPENFGFAWASGLVSLGGLLELASFLWRTIAVAGRVRQERPDGGVGAGGAHGVGHNLLQALASAPHAAFNWPLFGIGEALAFVGIALLMRRLVIQRRTRNAPR